MSPVKTIAACLCATGLLIAPASAVTVKNNSSKQISIGIDRGDKESVEKIDANASAKFDCKEQCGFTGPWGFSWMAKGDETITTDGNSLVTTTAAEQG